MGLADLKNAFSLYELFFYRSILYKFCTALEATKYAERLYLEKPEDLLICTSFARLNSYCSFSTLTDIVVVDYPTQFHRFKICYNFLSTFYAKRCLILASAPEASLLPSLFHSFPASNWLEREAWDLYGIYFHNHPDLRRILTDYGFRGYPMRKDFPLTGYLELRYDDAAGDIVYEPVELSQELRFFNFNSGWELDK